MIQEMVHWSKQGAVLFMLTLYIIGKLRQYDG